MKHLRSIPLLIAIFAMTLTCSYALTADELARYLGVSSWTTVIDLPPQSFVAEIWSIKDGVPEKQLIEGMAAWNKMPEKGITIMLGSQDNKYKIAIAYGGGVTMTTATSIPSFNSTMGSSLPKTLAEGDYALYGTPKEKGLKAEDVASYKAGFLLRIKKNS